MAPSLPWLIGTDLLEDSAQIPNFYSPFDQTLHRLRLPSSLPFHYFLASAHGWILIIHENTVPSAHITSSLRTPSPAITSSALLSMQSSNGTPSAAPSSSDEEMRKKKVARRGNMNGFREGALEKAREKGSEMI